MHMIIAMTFLHTRLLEGSPQSDKSPAETFHWFRAMALFNEKLNIGVFPDDRDALWATAVLLGASMFTSCEETSPENAWPLKSPSSTDLDWLRLTDGKKAIFKIANPLRPDSLFSSLASVHQKDYLPCSTISNTVLQTLPSGLLALCVLHVQSNPEKSNAYYSTVRALAPLLQISCSGSTIVKYLSFISHFDPDFRDMLVDKDPLALLILAYWYAKVCRYEWWIAKRAMVECRAICIYLTRYYQDHTTLQDCVRSLRHTYNIADLAI
jgi:hypothetical protein